jgi:hypothetical protein
MKNPGELNCGSRLRKLRCDRSSKVLDICHFDDFGILSSLNPDAQATQRLDYARNDEGLLFAILSAAQELLGQVIINRRVGAPSSRAGQPNG